MSAYTIATDPETLRDIEQDERDTTIREDRITETEYAELYGDIREHRNEPTDEQINEMLERCYEIEECKHPSTALFTWYANDPTKPDGRSLVITCTNCHSVIRGGATA